MRYYIRHDKKAKVEGPFTVEALTDAIRAGQIPPEALASSDLGADGGGLQVWRNCDWFPLATITELRELVPPLPEPTLQPRRVTVFAVICYLVAALGFSYNAITERRLFVCLLAVLMVFCAVAAIVRYVRQKENRSPAI